MKKSLLMGIIMMMLTIVVFPVSGQMNYWGIMPNKIDFTGTPTLSTMSGAPGIGTNQGYNAIWDGSGSLLFYIVGGVIYRPNNTGAGSISVPTASFNTGIPPVPAVLYPKQDVYHIVPAPGSTTRYYVFHTAFANFSGVALIYTIVDCPTPGTVTVTNPANARLYDISIGNSSSLAITKPRVDNTRYLFYVSNAGGGTTTDAIKYFVISSTGITAPASNTVYSASLNTSTMESVDAEVYEDQDYYYLSWAAGYEKFSCIKLNVSTLALAATYNYTLPSGVRPANVEFTADGKSIYATATGGVYKTTITGTPTLVAGSANYYATQIELAKDGLFYLVNQSTGALSTLNPATNTFAASPIGLTLASTIRSFFVNGVGYIYTLPEQLDQENYFCITTQPSIPYNATLNYGSVPLTQACPSSWSIGTCGGTTFNTAHSVTPAAYMFDIQSINGSCGIDPDPLRIHYNSGWVTGAPPANYNIGALTDANGVSLITVPAGQVRITYYVKNSCGLIRSVYTNINTNNPKPALTDFKLNNTTITSSCATPYNVFTCTTPSLLLTPVQKNPGTGYLLTIQAVDASCNPVTGTGLINYTSGWQSAGSIPANTELLTLTDANGVNLSNYSGLVLITYTVSDNCMSTTVVSHKVRMNKAPTPAGSALTINSYTSGGVPVAASATAPGIQVGVFSGGFNMSSNSAFNDYTVVIEEVDCTTGSVIGSICNINTVLANPLTSVTAINLNMLNVPAIPAKSWSGGMGFFASKGYGSCFRLYVTPNNTCGSTTLSSYIKSDCFCRMGTAEGIIVEEGTSAFYPTVFEDELYADYILEGSENIVSVKVYDLSGRLISTPLENVSQSVGTNHLKINVPSLKSGSYIFVVEANGHKYSQLLTKK